MKDVLNWGLKENVFSKEIGHTVVILINATQQF